MQTSKHKSAFHLESRSQPATDRTSHTSACGHGLPRCPSSSPHLEVGFQEVPQPPGKLPGSELGPSSKALPCLGSLNPGSLVQKEAALPSKQASSTQGCPLQVLCVRPSWLLRQKLPSSG